MSKLNGQSFGTKKGMKENHIVAINMWEKTAIKKVANLNEGNEEVQKALDIDDQGETGTPIYDLEIEEEPKEEKKTATKKLSERISGKNKPLVIGVNLSDETRDPGDEAGEIPSHVQPTQGDLK